MRICRKLLCCPFVWGSHWEPCHRVAYGIQPARTHLFDRCKHLCGWISHAKQRKSAGSVTSMFWNTHEIPAHLNSLIFWLETGLFLRNEQVRRVDQTRYPMIVVASLSAVPQSCRTPLLFLFSLRNRGGHTHTHTKPEAGKTTDVGRAFGSMRSPMKIDN